MSSANKRDSYKHEHLDEIRRRKGALDRLEAQLVRLTAKDKSALFKSVDFEAKLKFVKQQITNIKSKRL